MQYFVQAFGATEIQNDKHVRQLFETFSRDGLNKMIKELVEEEIESLVDCVAPIRTTAQHIIQAVGSKMDEIQATVAGIDTGLRRVWQGAFNDAKFKLLPHEQRRTSLVKTLFHKFMKGTAANIALGRHRLDALSRTFTRYNVFCEDELATLRAEYEQRQRGLHAQLQLGHTAFYFLTRTQPFGGTSGNRARLGRHLTQTRGGPTSCFYRADLNLRGVDELRQLLAAHPGPPGRTWAQAQSLVGPDVFNKLTLTVEGAPLNGHARRSDLLLSLAAEIYVREGTAVAKESLADAMQGILLVHELTRAKAGQQQGPPPMELNIESRVDSVRLLQAFASLHEVNVDVFYFSEEATPPQVTAIYRIPNPRPTAQAAASRRAVSYKVCWSKRNGFGPAWMDRRVHITARSVFGGLEVGDGRTHCEFRKVNIFLLSTTHFKSTARRPPPRGRSLGLQAPVRIAEKTERWGSQANRRAKRFTPQPPNQTRWRRLQWQCLFGT